MAYLSHVDATLGGGWGRWSLVPHASWRVCPLPPARPGTPAAATLASVHLLLHTAPAGFPCCWFQPQTPLSDTDGQGRAQCGGHVGAQAVAGSMSQAQVAVADMCLAPCFTSCPFWGRWGRCRRRRTCPSYPCRAPPSRKPQQPPSFPGGYLHSRQAGREAGRQWVRLLMGGGS